MILLETPSGSTTIAAPCMGRRVTVGVSKIVKRDYAGRLLVRPTAHGVNLLTWTFELSHVHRDDKDNLRTFVEAHRHETVDLTFDDEPSVRGSLTMSELVLPMNSVQTDLVTAERVPFYDVTLSLEEVR